MPEARNIVSYTAMAYLRPNPRVVGHDPLHVRLFEVDSVVIDRPWDSRGVRDSFWRLYVNNRDGAALEMPDGDFELLRNRVYFVPAWVTFGFHCAHPVGSSYAHFDPVGLPGTLVREVFDRPIALPPDADPALARDFTRATQRTPPAAVLDLPSVLGVKAAIYRALVVLFDALPEHQARRFADHAAGDDPVYPAVRHIESHLNEPLPNADLARLCHMSTDHFIRRFRTRLGQTPSQFVLERRVALAAQRLAFTADTIDQIAGDCGFANRFYFSRIFARVMGVAPARYRDSGHA